MMTTAAIVESNMTFGPFAEGHCFYVEKSKAYQAIKTGVPMVEFFLLRPTGDVWIVEAKSSSPQPGSEVKFTAFIEEIKAKLVNGLSLAVSARLGWHPAAAGELSNQFKAIDLSTINFKLVLVIRGHKAEWLPPLTDAMTKALQPTVKTWGLRRMAVAVLNEVGAEKHGLISPRPDPSGVA